VQYAANAFIDLMAPAMGASGQMKLIINTQLRYRSALRVRAKVI
jgi:hypothetical protein